MSAHIEYRCDMCATPGQGRWQRYGFGPQSPKGWQHFDGKHLCSYACLIELIKELESAERGKRLLPDEDAEGSA